MNEEKNDSELVLFRDNVKRFISENIQPDFMRWEKGEIFTCQLWNQIGEAGLLCVDLPEAFGGCEVSFRYGTVVTEELSSQGLLQAMPCTLILWPHTYYIQVEAVANSV